MVGVWMPPVIAQVMMTLPKALVSKTQEGRKPDRENHPALSGGVPGRGD